MPTKRRPLKHGPRIGEVRVTSPACSISARSFQDEVPASTGPRYTPGRRPVEQALLQIVLCGELPWEDTGTYASGTTTLPAPSAGLPRPEDTAEARPRQSQGADPLIDAYERKRQAAKSCNLNCNPNAARLPQAVLVKRLRNYGLAVTGECSETPEKQQWSGLGDRGSGVQISPLRPLSTRRRISGRLAPEGAVRRLATPSLEGRTRDTALCG